MEVPVRKMINLRDQADEDRLYAIAKRVTLNAGFDYTDPRTGETTEARREGGETLPVKKSIKKKASTKKATKRVATKKRLISNPDTLVQ